MTYKIPPTTKLFLTKLMEEKIHQNVGGDYIDFKKSYLLKFNNLQEEDCSKYFSALDSGEPLSMYIPPECMKAYEEKKKKANFGTGGSGKTEPKPGPEYIAPKDGTNVNFYGIDTTLRKDILDIPAGDVGTLGGAAILTGLGGIAEPMLKSGALKLAGKIADKVPGLGPFSAKIGMKAAEALSDILGTSYVGVNVDDIPFQNTKNLIQGAGKPFYQLQVPVRQDDKYDWWRRQALVQQQQS